MDSRNIFSSLTVGDKYSFQEVPLKRKVIRNISSQKPVSATAVHRKTFILEAKEHNCRSQEADFKYIPTCT